jgi:hypothetical protein
MKFYKFDDITQDEEFLKGKPVTGKVALLTEDEPVKKNDPMVVVLSSGKKFKGRISDVRLFSVDKYTVGEIEIIRA